jgi:uncharacterized protein
MRLYSGMSEDFIRDTTRNRIAERLREAFFAYYRYQPGPSEVNSWRNSLRAMSGVLDIGSLHDHGILLEYQLPLSSKRIDCIVCGEDDRIALTLSSSNSSSGTTASIPTQISWFVVG